MRSTVEQDVMRCIFDVASEHVHPLLSAKLHVLGIELLPSGRPGSHCSPYSRDPKE
jgi:hypothetical protein